MSRREIFESSRPSQGLTDEQKGILDVASLHHSDVESRNREIMSRTGLDPLTFFTKLAHTIDHPEAEQHSPETVRYLKHLREQHKE